MVPIEHVLRDERVRAEVAAYVGERRPLPKGEEWDVTPAMVGRVLAARPTSRGELATRPYTEAVIRNFGRPVLLIRKNRIELPRSREIRDRLLPARARLEARVPSVGRVEFVGHPERRWGGTGWVIAENVIVTNRHVAELFAQRKARGFTFRANLITGDPMQARIDFREEYRQGRTPAFEVGIKRILLVEEHRKSAPDVAFLQMDPAADLPAPIPLSDGAPRDDSDVAVVGYPARDPRGTPDETAAHRIFGDIYEVKRLSPGKVLVSDAGPWFFTHDATTLGGNSGSVVLDLETGAALGLHFAGELEEANFAVNARRLADYLGKLRLRSSILTPSDGRSPAAEPVEEAPPADYGDRGGFDPAFLGGRARVDLPTKVERKTDVFTWLEGRRRTGELKYNHFSLAMSKRRKVCLWSAVNIDGRNSRKASRTGWKVDPRIPRDAQLTGDEAAGDVYGNEPRFARGHMTRREDPIWGPEAEALLGNSDSMHLTNAVPQMQPFNAGIWNNLEDYALLNARKDKMRISVITGPVLSADDPERYGVQIPIEFWKVIAFIHDDTGRLTATGYLMSQSSFLEPEEFVYGRHETYQVPIKTIEHKTGLSFGTLARRDPLRNDPGGESATPALMHPGDIRFTADD